MIQLQICSFLKRHPNSHITLTNDRTVKVQSFLVFSKVKVKLLISLKSWLAFFLCQDVSLVYSMFSFVTTDLPTKEIVTRDTAAG